MVAIPDQTRKDQHLSALKKKPKSKMPKSKVTLIKSLGVLSFAKVLGQIKTKAEPEQLDTVIKSTQRTQSKGVLFEKLKDKVGVAATSRKSEGKGSVRILDSKTSVEIRDLDGLSTKEVGAIKNLSPNIQRKQGEHSTVQL